MSSISLQSVAELAWRQLFPNPKDETAITKEEFIETARSEYAYQMWKLAKEEKSSEGVFNIPSQLLSEADVQVIDNRADISDLEILRSLPDDMWIQNVGGLDCECMYVRTNVNHNQLMCDDDSIGDNSRTFLMIGNIILFPKGVHKNPIRLIYANNGIDIDDSSVAVDDAIGGIIRTKLIEIYGGKIGKEDVTNNTNDNE
jgi:hypothetical protein